jgi:hypothetical protein
MTNRRWQVPPTLISASLQRSNELPFALGFVITYQNLLQKEDCYCLIVLVKKMGSLQKAKTKCLKILKIVKKKRFEETVEKALMD